MKRKSSDSTLPTTATSPLTTAASIFCSSARTSAASLPPRSAASSSATITLLDDLDRGVRPVRRHVDVVRFDDQPRVGIALLLQDNFLELRVVVRGLQTRVALGLRRISTDIDEGVVGVDAEFLVALQGDEVADVGDAVTRIGRCGPAPGALPGGRMER